MWYYNLWALSQRSLINLPCPGVGLSLPCSRWGWSSQVKCLPWGLKVLLTAQRGDRSCQESCQSKSPSPVFHSLTTAFILEESHFWQLGLERWEQPRGGEHPLLSLLWWTFSALLRPLAMILFYGDKLDILTIQISKVTWKFPALDFYLAWSLEGAASGKI